jgi:outer membrane protein assembly factor BamB
MSRRRSATGLAWAVVGALALATGGLLSASEEDPAAPGEIELIPSLRASDALVRKLVAARGFLETGSWAEAVPLLQALLDAPDDALVGIPRTPKAAKAAEHWTGLRAEAVRLLGALPAEGQEAYNAACGPPARNLLADARRKGDSRLLAEVARRYPHTAAGVEAAALLGLFHLDRARPQLAAGWFRRLTDHADADAVPVATWYYAALAFRRAGDAVGAEQAERRMAAQARGGLRLGGRWLSLGELQEELDRAGGPATVKPALGPESVPSLEARWTRPTTSEALSRHWLESSLEQNAARGKANLSACAPVVAGGRLVYRSNQGLHAVEARSGKLAWEFPSVWSLDGMARHPTYIAHIDSWVSAYLDGRGSPQVLFANGILGTLSTDGSRVYAVDDLAVPPYAVYSRPRRRWQEPAVPELGPELADAADSSRLFALDAATGKLLWQIGGHSDSPSETLSDCYFLGPPLPLEGRLYSLTEKNTEITLVCLNNSGALEWSQPLAYAPTRLRHDPGRRLHAAVPVYAEGVLVCPTNAGVVVGVDVTGTGLLWAHAYRSEPLTAVLQSFDRRRREVRSQLKAEWEAAGVVVGQGRALVSAPDSPAIHCLNLRDGSLLWQAQRADDDLYVAGLCAGKLLVVGKRSCRALDLADGEQLWQLETGEPSGRGAFRGTTYYLPLKAAAGQKGPAIYAIDCLKGVITSRLPWPGKEAPGNLHWTDKGLVSQTATAVTVHGRRCCSWK